MTTLPQKNLIIAVIENDNSILMRKKPEGSLPYKETWYLFGCEVIPTQDNSKTIKDYLKSTLGIEVEIDTQSVSYGTEEKVDHDGILKFFIYINLKCIYRNGELRTPEGVERVAWIEKNKLKEYDLVPPSKKLLEELGYIK